jgi:hypothetical protein
MQIPKLLLAVPLIMASLTFSAAAKPDNANKGRGHGHAYGRSTSTPAPISGLGLIGLAPTAAFLYWFYRRYRQDRD